MAEVSPGPPPQNPAPKDNGRKKKAIGLFLVVLAVTVIAGFAYWKYRQTHVSTDDAYVDGRIHLVSARVQGTVAEVRVRDNQPVRARDPLLRIDPEPFAVREASAAFAVSGGAADLVAARKDVEAANAQLRQLSAGIEAARARTVYSAARLAQAERDAARMKQLFEKQVVSREAFEKAQTDAETAKAQDDLAKEELLLAKAAIPKPEMGNATSIYNLLRNLGGSIGVSFSATMFAHRAQVHQSRLAEHLTGMDEGLRAAVAKGQALLPSRGVPEAIAGNATLARIYGEMVRQATMMGFNDAFYVLSVMMACVLPLLFLLRRPAHQTAPIPGH